MTTAAGKYWGHELLKCIRRNSRNNCDYLAAAEESLAYNPDLTLSDGNGFSALCLAAQYGLTGLAAKLVAAGAPVNHQDFTEGHGITPLMHAIGEKHMEIVDLLLENGADVNLRTRDGRTALFFASHADSVWKSTDMVWHLLEKSRPDLNAVTVNGQTILAHNGSNLQNVALLIAAGADIEAVNCNGKDAYADALFNNQPAVKIYEGIQATYNGFAAHKTHEVEGMAADFMQGTAARITTLPRLRLKASP